MSSAGVGLYAAVTPLVAAAIGALALFVRRARSYREAASRSSGSRSEIDRILLEAKIREAKQREAEARGDGHGLMGLFGAIPKPLSREQAKQILQRAEVQEELRAAGIDPASLQQELEHGELRVVDGRTTISMNATMQLPRSRRRARTRTMRREREASS